jgi:hypothetical protein
MDTHHKGTKHTDEAQRVLCVLFVFFVALWFIMAA